MDSSNDLQKREIFPKGEKIANEYFTETAWLQVLVPDDSTLQCPTYNVTLNRAPGTTGINIPAARSCSLTAAEDTTRKRAGRHGGFIQGTW
jgi:hypothetical protein